MTDRRLVRFSLGIGLAALLLASGCRGDARDPRQVVFGAADADKDGRLTLDEFEKTAPGKSAEGLEKRFAQADADHDDRLTLEEFRTVPNGHRILWTLGIFSAVSFVGSIIAIPIVVARLPVDHFVAPHEAADWVTSDIRRRLWLVLKNVLGLLLIVGGVMMLVLPGQGLLTILLGVALTDFPGKWRMMRALARRPEIMKALNWMRERADKPPLLAPEKKESRPGASPASP
ncbi:MAG TPA: PGPGW domain-containing protein [Caulifigura sp.]|nr:PGPGW domain-containing protein [Caulifigura sp.]